MRVDPVESVGPNTREVAFLLVTERRIGDELAHGVMNSLTLVGMKVLVRLFERRLLTERDRQCVRQFKGLGLFFQRPQSLKHKLDRKIRIVQCGSPHLAPVSHLLRN